MPKNADGNFIQSLIKEKSFVFLLRNERKEIKWYFSGTLNYYSPSSIIVGKESRSLLKSNFFFFFLWISNSRDCNHALYKTLFGDSWKFLYFFKKKWKKVMSFFFFNCASNRWRYEKIHCSRGFLLLQPFLMW